MQAAGALPAGVPGLYGLDGGSTKKVHVTYEELDRQAQALAAWLLYPAGVI
jgi:hypothetical protein